MQCQKIRILQSKRFYISLLLNIDYVLFIIIKLNSIIIIITTIINIISIVIINIQNIIYISYEKGGYPKINILNNNKVYEDVIISTTS